MFKTLDALANYLDRVLAMMSNHMRSLGNRRVMHIKGSGPYEVLGVATAQVSTRHITTTERERTIRDFDRLTVYRDEASDKLYVRFEDEFEDGRFADI